MDSRARLSWNLRPKIPLPSRPQNRELQDRGLERFATDWKPEGEADESRRSQSGADLNDERPQLYRVPFGAYPPQLSRGYAAVLLSIVEGSLTNEGRSAYAGKSLANDAVGIEATSPDIQYGEYRLPSGRAADRPKRDVATRAATVELAMVDGLMAGAGCDVQYGEETGVACSRSVLRDEMLHRVEECESRIAVSGELSKRVDISRNEWQIPLGNLLCSATLSQRERIGCVLSNALMTAMSDPLSTRPARACHPDTYIVLTVAACSIVRTMAPRESLQLDPP